MAHWFAIMIIPPVLSNLFLSKRVIPWPRARPSLPFSRSPRDAISAFAASPNPSRPPSRLSRSLLVLPSGLLLSDAISYRWSSRLFTKLIVPRLLLFRFALVPSPPPMPPAPDIGVTDTTDWFLTFWWCPPISCRSSCLPAICLTRLIRV